jgi:Tfp pilus assembly protein PilV
MPSPTHRSPPAGFALTEALVALLLLAMATIGAGGAMLYSLAGQRAALLRTQATDLAADLAEALRSAPDVPSQDAEIRAWEAAVLHRMPETTPQAARRAPFSPRPDTSVPAGFDIRLQWRDGRSPPSSRLSLSMSLQRSQNPS